MDPIANFLTSIRNAQLAKLKSTTVPYSKIKESICKILKSERYISGYEVVSSDSSFNKITINLRYINTEPAITKIKRVSKPSLRLYTTYKKMPRVLSGKGITILTSSLGVITNRQARKNGVGGEIICSVY